MFVSAPIIVNVLPEPAPRINQTKRKVELSDSKIQDTTSKIRLAGQWPPLPTSLAIGEDAGIVAVKGVVQHALAQAGEHVLLRGEVVVGAHCAPETVIKVEHLQKNVTTQNRIDAVNITYPL